MNQEGEYDVEKEKKLAKRIAEAGGEKDKLSSSASSERMIQKAEIRRIERREKKLQKIETKSEMREHYGKKDFAFNA